MLKSIGKQTRAVPPDQHKASRPTTHEVEQDALHCPNPNPNAKVTANQAYQNPQTKGGPVVHNQTLTPSQITTQATTGENKQTKAGKIKKEELARMLAEENESKGKIPDYPGLERWKLIGKMGDGAFSNVYRAVDLEGQEGEVAIKVVRKYEMNSNQVSS